MTAAPKTVPAYVACWILVMRRPGPMSGKANAEWEVTARCTTQATGVEVQASGERSAEIMSGRAISQQGLTTTCKDPMTEVEAEGRGRVMVWRMSWYERGRGGNALRGGARHHPGWSRAPSWQSSSGHLAVPGRSPGSVPEKTSDPRSRDEAIGKPHATGAYASQCLNLVACGKANSGKPRSEPDSGKPTVRDRRGAQGNVAQGGTVNPSRNRKGGNGNPPPKSARTLDLSRPEWLRLA